MSVCMIALCRFQLQSTESGLIFSCYEIAQCLSLLFIAYFGGKGNKAVWLGWGIMASGLSSIIFSLPHFLAPAYEILNSSMDTCSPERNVSLAGMCTALTLRNYR